MQNIGRLILHRYSKKEYMCTAPKPKAAQK